jgi:hypothetical protein
MLYTFRPECSMSLYLVLKETAFCHVCLALMEAQVKVT